MQKTLNFSDFGDPFPPSPLILAVKMTHLRFRGCSKLLTSVSLTGFTSCIIHCRTHTRTHTATTTTTTTTTTTMPPRASRASRKTTPPPAASESHLSAGHKHKKSTLLSVLAGNEDEELRIIAEQAGL